MSKDFDINDPEFWRSIDWDADEKGPVIKSDHSVNKSNANRARWKNPENRKQQSERMQALAKDTNWSEKVNAMLKARAKDPDWQRKNRESAKLRAQDPVARKKQSDSMKKHIKENPDALLPLHTASKEYHSLESTKQLKSERMLNKWTDAEYRDNMKKLQDELWQDKQHIEKCREAGAHRFVAVVTPFGEYECGSDFEREHPIKLRDRFLQMPHLYYRKADGPGEPTYETVYVTVFGEFPSMRTAQAQAVELGLTEPNEDPKKWWRTVSMNKSQYYTQKQKRREWGAKKIASRKKK